jgi:predicted transcriptional regulator
VSGQYGQALQRGPVGDPDLDRVELRRAQASNQVGVGGPRLHGLIVPVAPTETEGKGQRNQTATDGNLVGGAFPSKLVAAVTLALARCGLSHKEAADLMGLTPGQWSKQLSGSDGHHVQLDRLARLPETFQVEFVRLYGEAVGMAVAHQSIAGLLVARVGQLLVEANALHAQLAALELMRRAG